MKLEDIQSQWEVDSKIDRTVLGDEALKISELHHKYYKILSNERLVLKRYESDLKVLQLEKQEFFIMGPTEETQEKGWKLPPCGKVLRADVPTYVAADSEVIKHTLKIGMQNEKISLLTSIIQTISNRNFNIKSYIDFEKFKNGISF